MAGHPKSGKNRLGQQLNCVDSCVKESKRRVTQIVRLNRYNPGIKTNYVTYRFSPSAQINSSLKPKQADTFTNYLSVLVSSKYPLDLYCPKQSKQSYRNK